MKRLFIILLLTVCTVAQAKSSDALLENERNTIEVFKRVAPLVVNVHDIRNVVGPYPQGYYVRTGVGSGFLWDNRGYIVTNYHVIRGAHNIVISLGKDKVIRADVVGAEPRKDIAVLKLFSTKELTKFKPLAIADSNDLAVGQKTIAIGNPFGLDRTLTTGIISALGRGMRGVAGVTIRDMIQTDASINPGNSGGPLLNSKGELIGMNTMIYSRSGGSAGIGFAVPADDIKRIVNQIIRFGRVIQPSLGIYRINDSIARQLGVKGVIVGEVIFDSPAEKAGLRGTYRDALGKIQLGDIITAVDEQPIKNYDDLYNALDQKKIGEKITVHFLRNGKARKVQLQTVDSSENIR